MATLSPARAFFDQIVNADTPVEAIRKLINLNEPVVETDWLDFKGENPNPQHREKSHRQGWSENLTAFANTGGGVLIWGLDARKKPINGREIDCVCGESLVEDPIALAARLNEWQGQATNPAIAGVEIKPYVAPDVPGKGFVVCFIPQGSLKPYQSLQTADKQYYLRGGCNNFVMDRAVLASMFYPRACAAFRVRASLSWASPDADGVGFREFQAGFLKAELFITNEGAATAKDVYVTISVCVPGKHAAQHQHKGGPFRAGDDRYFCTLPTALHPTQTADIMELTSRIDGATLSQFSFSRTGWPQTSLEITIFCENQQPQTRLLAFNLESLIRRGSQTLEGSAIEQ